VTQPATSFVKVISRLDATALVVGSMIGSGIFIVSSAILREVGTPGLLLTVWAVSGVLTLLGALTYGELAAMYPKAGGQYVYLREGISPLFGYLYGWTLFTVIQTGTIAAVAVAFARFTGILVPGLTEEVFLGGTIGKYQVGLSGQRVLAIASIALLTWINVRGVRTAALIQTSLTIIKTAALAGLIVLGVTIGRNAAAIADNFGAGFWPAGGLTLQQATDGRPVRPPAVDVDADSPAMIMYTSGTTGFPKGVLYSHASFLGVYHGVVIEGDMRHDDVVMVTMPLFHNGGLNVLLQPALMLGATAVIMAKGFDPDATLEAVARDRVTLTMWVPTMLAMLARRGIGSHDTSSLKTLWYGSSPIAAPVLAAAREMFDAGFYQWYGQTETGMNSVLRPEDHAQRSQCTGREMFNAELRIVDGDGRDVPVGGVGEIISAQRCQGMIGYWKNEEATRATIRDGWIYTGDLARVEGDGYFTVIDRKRDMIISGAENIYPKEIEDLLVTHPAVSEVAVFGIPDDIYGESVAAAVVRKEGHEVDEQEIIAFCATRLASYKKPRRVEFVAELPKNATGKVTKHVLRAPFWPGRGR